MPVSSILHSAGFVRANIPRFLAELGEFLRFRSISSQSRFAVEMESCAAWFAGHLRRIGMDNASVVTTGGHPLVFAEWRNAPGRPTVLIYGHYDVQPPDPPGEWHTPPFEPVVRGDYLFARGATDDKGQLFTHVKAMETWLATTGTLPVNVICLFEGEEETGSKNLHRFLQENRHRLKADMAIVSDTLMPTPDRPTVTYALRGVLGLELEVAGQRNDLHSGHFGGMVHNPLQALCEIIAKLHDPDMQIAVPDFYNRVKNLSIEERHYMKETGPGDAELLENAGAQRGWGEAGYTLYERTTVRPALIVTGISGGYQGEGGKGVIPASARAKIEIRLAPQQDPREIERLFRLHISRLTPPTITTNIRTLSRVRPVTIDPAHPLFRAVENAYLRGFGRKPAYWRSGGSIPVVAALQEIGGMPVALMGFGLASACIHAPNESLYLPNFLRGIATSFHLLDELGRVHILHGGNRP
ncbi:MAG TPA: dipeptidase [Geobacteraceae bacterium]|nr:dipeptidase [Geobacteraceae bacterium]